MSKDERFCSWFDKLTTSGGCVILPPPEGLPIRRAPVPVVSIGGRVPGVSVVVPGRREIWWSLNQCRRRRPAVPAPRACAPAPATRGGPGANQPGSQGARVGILRWV